jgi:hypothetical protein
MTENQPPAADPQSDHETPGGNPAQGPEGPNEAQPSTTVETPGGTTVEEHPQSPGALEDENSNS